MGKRELFALFGLSCWCLVIVVWVFLVVSWVCLQFVIVVFSDHTHLLFLLPSLLEGSGSVSECLTRDWEVEGLSITGGTPCVLGQDMLDSLALVQHRRTRLNLARCNLHMLLPNKQITNRLNIPYDRKIVDRDRTWRSIILNFSMWQLSLPYYTDSE